MLLPASPRLCMCTVCLKPSSRPQTRIGPSAHCSQLLKDYVWLGENSICHHYTMPTSFMVLGHQRLMYGSVIAASQHRGRSTRSMCSLVTVHHRTSFAECIDEPLSKSLQSAQRRRHHRNEIGRCRGSSPGCGTILKLSSVWTQRLAASLQTLSLLCVAGLATTTTSQPSIWSKNVWKRNETCSHPSILHCTGDAGTCRWCSCC